MCQLSPPAHSSNCFVKMRLKGRIKTTWFGHLTERAPILRRLDNQLVTHEALSRDLLTLRNPAPLILTSCCGPNVRLSCNDHHGRSNTSVQKGARHPYMSFD